MKLKIPPALQVALFATLMWLTKNVTNIKHLDFKHQEAVSWLLFCIGVLIGGIAVYSFRKENTTVDPINPEKASQLVITGIYKFTRNPMYVGLLFILISFAIKLGNLYACTILPLYIWYNTRNQIKPEEEALTMLFGKEFINYKKTVRRWI